MADSNPCAGEHAVLPSRASSCVSSDYRAVSKQFTATTLMLLPVGIRET